MKQECLSYAAMLPVIVFMSILYTKNQHKTIAITICETEFREKISLKITRPDASLLKQGK